MAASRKELFEEFKTKLLDIYDLNKLILDGTKGMYQSFVDTEVCVIQCSDGSGFILNYEACGKKFENLDEQLKFDVAEPEKEEVQEDGSIVRSMALYPYGTIKLTPRQIIKNAESHQEEAGDFFKKCYGSNWRCNDNLADVLDLLEKSGYFDTESVLEDLKTKDNKSVGERLAKCISKAFIGECGPFGGQDAKVKGNKLTLWSQADPCEYTFYDDGSCEAQYTDEDGDAFGRDYDNALDLLDEDMDGWFAFFDEYPNSVGVREEVEQILSDIQPETFLESKEVSRPTIKNVTYSQWYNIISSLAEHLDRDDFIKRMCTWFPMLGDLYEESDLTQHLWKWALDRDWTKIENQFQLYSDLEYMINYNRYFDEILDLYYDVIKEDSFLEKFEVEAWKGLDRISKEEEAWLDKQIEEHNFKVVSKRDYGHYGDDFDQMLDVHYQIISNEGDKTKEDLDKEVDWIDELLDRFEGRTGSPCTYNMGLQVDGYISCGFDCRAKSDYYKDKILEQIKIGKDSHKSYLENYYSINESIKRDNRLREGWKVIWQPEPGDRVRFVKPLPKVKFFAGQGENDKIENLNKNYLGKEAKITGCTNWDVFRVTFDDGYHYDKARTFYFEPVEDKPETYHILESADYNSDDFVAEPENEFILCFGDGNGAASRGLDEDTFYVFETKADSLREAVNNCEKEIRAIDRFDEYDEYDSSDNDYDYIQSLDPTGGDIFLAGYIENGKRHLDVYMDDVTEDNFADPSKAHLFIDNLSDDEKDPDADLIKEFKKRVTDSALNGKELDISDLADLFVDRYNKRSIKESNSIPVDIKIVRKHIDHIKVKLYTQVETFNNDDVEERSKLAKNCLYTVSDIYDDGTIDVHTSLTEPTGMVRESVENVDKEWFEEQINIPGVVNTLNGEFVVIDDKEGFLEGFPDVDYVSDPMQYRLDNVRKDSWNNIDLYYLSEDDGQYIKEMLDDINAYYADTFENAKTIDLAYDIDLIIVDGKAYYWQGKRLYNAATPKGYKNDWFKDSCKDSYLENYVFKDGEAEEEPYAVFQVYATPEDQKTGMTKGCFLKSKNAIEYCKENNYYCVEKAYGYDINTRYDIIYRNDEDKYLEDLDLDSIDWDEDQEMDIEEKLKYVDSISWKNATIYYLSNESEAEWIIDFFDNLYDAEDQTTKNILDKAKIIDVCFPEDPDFMVIDNKSYEHTYNWLRPLDGLPHGYDPEWFNKGKQPETYLEGNKRK